ncbi:MAG: UDP-2,3-diacylglucosamine diphosphatase [Acidobacteriota bacterium]
MTTLQRAVTVEDHPAAFLRRFADLDNLRHFPRPDGHRLVCRTAFISDTHLGSLGARADALVEVLDRLECERLYLVGDIIDMWQLRRRWRWSEACDRAIGRILQMARTGTDVVYIPGNHDEAARRFVGLEFGGVRIRALAEHTTADGRRLLVTHGDQFDLVIRHSPLLCMLGDVAYNGLIRINTVWNRLRRLFGRPYWSLSAYVKSRVKTACTFVSRFEEAVEHEAARQQLDGVVCGHIHQAEIRDSADGVAYYNCGDWVESCTLLVERDSGTLELIDGLSLVDERPTAEDAARRAPQAISATAS